MVHLARCATQDLYNTETSDMNTVACRGPVMPGVTAWLDAPLPNSSIEQMRIVVIVIGYLKKTRVFLKPGYL